MESRINYTLVGLFVALLMAGLIAFAFWLGKYGGEQEYDNYYVYFSESVAGLSTDTSVKYNGVDVGTVEHIGINLNNPNEAELLLRIKRGTPVKMDTKAKLKSFGITGLVFIELTGSSKASPLLQKTGDSPPVIMASPSTFAQVDKSLNQLAEKFTMALDRFEQLLSEENLANFTTLLSETAKLAKDVRGQLHGFQKLVDNGIVMERSIIEASDKVDAASVSVKKMADSLEKNYGRNMSQDLRHSLESFNQLLYELDLLAGDLQKMIRATEASPSDLLFKQSKPRPGPGEEGYREN